MTLRVIARAASWPVTEAEAKAQCRIDDTEDADQVALLNRLIRAASDAVGRAASLTLQPTTFEQRLAGWPACEPIRLETGPLREVESISYLDADGAEQTLDPAEWFVIDTPEGGDIWFQPSWSSPALAARPDAVRVRFVAGFNDPEASDGDDALDLPEQAKQAALLLVADWWKNRETGTEGVVSDNRVAMAFDRLVGQIRVYR